MVRYFRMIGWLEGASLLTLMGIAMPLKYIWHKPEAVHLVGSMHGGLFLLYVFLAFTLYQRQHWSRKEFILACIASVVPTGTFFFDHHHFKNLKRFR